MLDWQCVPNQSLLYTRIKVSSQRLALVICAFLKTDPAVLTGGVGGVWHLLLIYSQCAYGGGHVQLTTESIVHSIYSFVVISLLKVIMH